jgi:hypothetical protein
MDNSFLDDDHVSQFQNRETNGKKSVAEEMTILSKSEHTDHQESLGKALHDHSYNSVMIPTLCSGHLEKRSKVILPTLSETGLRKTYIF